MSIIFYKGILQFLALSTCALCFVLRRLKSLRKGRISLVRWWCVWVACVFSFAAFVIENVRNIGLFSVVMVFLFLLNFIDEDQRGWPNGR
jgi:hypothetical protein